MDYYGWPKYVPVAERKKKAEQHISSLKKKGVILNPVIVEGRAIAKTFWGKAWCDNLEAYSDFSSRLPRGRTYVRNGSVIDLQVTKGLIKAQVMGSSLYHVTIKVEPIAESKWKALIKACGGKINSLIELLQGKFSKAVMEIITRKEDGLFPKPSEIAMKCSCPDYADMCKHISAVLYGVGATLDVKPEWLFDLRHVNHVDLIAIATEAENLLQDHNQSIEDEELSALFGIEMANTAIELVTVKKDNDRVRKKVLRKSATKSQKPKPKLKQKNSEKSPIQLKQKAKNGKS